METLIPITQAVILAAGNGSRLRNSSSDLPKPLCPLGGIPLIVRAILTAREAGIREVLIVVGYQGDRIIKTLSAIPLPGIQIDFVRNEEWKKSNGLSLLRAEGKTDSSFLLMMADHVFEPRAVKKFLGEARSEKDLVLGIDKNFASIFHLADATKVRFDRHGRIQGIGKELRDFQAIDTGLFLCSRNIFKRLKELRVEEDDVSVSKLVARLAALGKVDTRDLTGCFWQDVDTPEEARHAEALLYKGLVKPTDGWVSRNFNRKISAVLTRCFLKLGWSPNQVTALVAALGVLSGVSVAIAELPYLLIGGLLFNLASILDGCDGEMARLTFSSTRRGEWLDTLADNLGTFSFLIGAGIGAYRQNPSGVVVLELMLVLFGTGMSLGLLCFYLSRFSHSGSLVAVEHELKSTAQGPRHHFLPWVGKLQFLLKRDFYATACMILAAFGQLRAILVLAMLFSNAAWIVFVIYKKDFFRHPRDLAILN